VRPGGWSAWSTGIVRAEAERGHEGAATVGGRPETVRPEACPERNCTGARVACPQQAGAGDAAPTSITMTTEDRWS
jgi:hypothetical protein